MCAARVEGRTSGKGMSSEERNMIQMESMLTVADNSGARREVHRSVVTAGIADVIIGAVQEATPGGSVKGDIVRCVIVRTVKGDVAGRSYMSQICVIPSLRPRIVLTMLFPNPRWSWDHVEHPLPQPQRTTSDTCRLSGDT